MPARAASWSARAIVCPTRQDRIVLGNNSIVVARARPYTFDDSWRGGGDRDFDWNVHLGVTRIIITLLGRVNECVSLCALAESRAG